jgi:hypothetical protein
VKAAREAFPDSAPDLLWYTAGANDLAEDEEYHACLEQAKSDSDAAQCIAKANAIAMACTETLLTSFWKQYPAAKVGQYNYAIPCLEGDCLGAAAQFLGGAYCLRAADPKVCLGRALVYWQSIYVDALQRRWPQPRYTGMNVLGAVQQASGVPGAAVGKPVLGFGANCSWEVACVHAKYGTPAATGIADAMWDLWLSNVTAPAA